MNNRQYLFFHQILGEDLTESELAILEWLLNNLAQGKREYTVFNPHRVIHLNVRQGMGLLAGRKLASSLPALDTGTRVSNESLIIILTSAFYNEILRAKDL